MSDHPNYKKVEPESTKPRPEYTWAERRAELNNLIESAGHHRKLERSQEELSNEFGVTQPTIWKDIQAVLEWRANNLGDNAEAELSILKTKAVQEKLDDSDAAAAYEIAAEHYELLMSMGVKDKAPEKHQVESGDAYTKWLTQGGADSSSDENE